VLKEWRKKCRVFVSEKRKIKKEKKKKNKKNKLQKKARKINQFKDDQNVADLFLC
jgi:hypothetical protein